MKRNGKCSHEFLHQMLAVQDWFGRISFCPDYKTSRVPCLIRPIAETKQQAMWGAQPASQLLVVKMYVLFEFCEYNRSAEEANSCGCWFESTGDIGSGRPIQKRCQPEVNAGPRLSKRCGLNDCRGEEGRTATRGCRRAIARSQAGKAAQPRTLIAKERPAIGDSRRLPILVLRLLDGPPVGTLAPSALVSCRPRPLAHLVLRDGAMDCRAAEFLGAI